MLKTPVPTATTWGIRGWRWLGDRPFASLSAFLASQDELAFTLEFPDRRDFIACTHPGMADRYLLEVSLTVESGAVVDSALSQRVQLGAI